VRALLQRLFGRRRAQTAAVCYLRENGPIAYEFDLFSTAARERADAMMAGNITWAWKGTTREWTELTRISLSAFLSDLSSGDVIVAGIEGDLPVDVSGATVKQWIRYFCRLQPSPLAAVISVTGGRQILYVQQHASEAVNTLLEAWGLDKGAAQRKAYPRLGPLTLEGVSEGL
jgi:hypothetical protein